MNEQAPLLPVTATSAPRRKNWVALIAAAAVVSFALGAVVVSSSSTATLLDGGAEGPVVHGDFGAVRGRFGRAPTDYETCRCCELITYVGDPNCDEGSSFLNALSAAGANEVHSYIRTPGDPNTWFAPTWAEASCGTLSDNVTKTEGCAVCGSCSLAAFSWDQCDAIQPQLDYGGDRTNKEQTASCAGPPFKETVEFVGIPYAEPPVGNLRWRAPRPIGPWIGEVRDASTVPAACPHAFDEETVMFGDQTNKEAYKGYSEDCLYLSVVAPREKTSSKLPVMVYIHGGSFWSGDTSATTESGDARKIATAQEGAIFVAMNYRLGPLGFLASTAISEETGEASMGNFGFQDQRLALMWVKEHIAAFGGDPNRITIAGQSAGAISVLGHLTSKLTPPDLFAGAMSFSGNAGEIVFFSLDEATTRGAAFLKCARAYAAARGHPCAEDSSDVECARSLSAEEVDFISNANHLPWINGMMRELCGETLDKPMGGYHPTVDGVEWDDFPVEMAKRGEFPTDAAVFIGDVANEVSRFLPVREDQVSAATMDAILAAVPSIVNEGFDPEKAQRALDSYNPKHREGESYPAWRSLEALWSDVYYNCANREIALGLAAAGRPVYLYLFTGWGDRLGIDGVGHGWDYGYIFDRSMSAKLSRYYTYDVGLYLDFHTPRAADAFLPCSPGVLPLDPPLDAELLHKWNATYYELGYVALVKLVDPRVIQNCGPPTMRNSTLESSSTRDADFGYVTSFLAEGEPGDAYGKAPHWPRFEPDSMKRAFINNATHIGDYASEACDLWREVDATKLLGLLYRALNLTLPGA